MEGPAGGSPEGLTVAVEGCGHGDLDNIYATIKDIEVTLHGAGRTV